MKGKKKKKKKKLKDWAALLFFDVIAVVVFNHHFVETVLVFALAHIGCEPHGSKKAHWRQQWPIRNKKNKMRISFKVTTVLFISGQ